jgi:hypothetical protein
MIQVLEEFIEAGIDPFPDSACGPGYRCSAQLVDGTFLPCVIIRQRKFIVDLAERRLAEERSGTGIFRNSSDPYREILAHFVASGNRVNAYNIKRPTTSRFAIPLSVLEQVRGETVMSWTGFVLEMTDGRSFAFGTTFLTAFFDLPEGYEFENVKAVINHSYLDEEGRVRLIREDAEKWRNSFSKCVVYREKPYFDCFV